MNEVKFNEEFVNDTDEIINLIEKANTYTALCKIKELYEDIYRDASCGEFYYTAQKSVYATKFEISISNGRNIGCISIDGAYDTIPNEVHQAIIKNYKAQAEKILPFLDDKIQQKKEIDRRIFRFVLILALLCFCIIIMLFIIEQKVKPKNSVPQQPVSTQEETTVEATTEIDGKIYKIVPNE